jgi:hypothetical protein
MKNNEAPGNADMTEDITRVTGPVVKQWIYRIVRNIRQSKEMLNYTVKKYKTHRSHM